MDVLSDVLSAVRLTGAVFFRVEASHPWVVETRDMSVIGSVIMPDVEKVIAFHVVLAGQSWAQIHDGATAPVLAGPGAVLIFSGGGAHTLSAIRGARADDVPIDLYRRNPDRPLPFTVRPGGG